MERVGEAKRMSVVGVLPTANNYELSTTDPGSGRTVTLPGEVTALVNKYVRHAERFLRMNDAALCTFIANAAQDGRWQDFRDAVADWTPRARPVPSPAYQINVATITDAATAIAAMQSGLSLTPSVTSGPSAWPFAAFPLFSPLSNAIRAVRDKSVPALRAAFAEGACARSAFYYLLSADFVDGLDILTELLNGLSDSEVLQRHPALIKSLEGHLALKKRLPNQVPLDTLFKAARLAIKKGRSAAILAYIQRGDLNLQELSEEDAGMLMDLLIKRWYFKHANEAEQTRMRLSDFESLRNVRNADHERALLVCLHAAGFQLAGYDTGKRRIVKMATVVGDVEVLRIAIAAVDGQLDDAESFGPTLLDLATVCGNAEAEAVLREAGAVARRSGKDWIRLF